VEVLDANERARIAGKLDHRAGAKDGIDGAALEAELAQVGSGEERARSFEKLGSGRPRGLVVCPAFS
jgi:hypothetical protein